MFDKDFDILIDTLFPLDWDKKNYKFNREEKDNVKKLMETFGL